MKNKIEQLIQESLEEVGARHVVPLLKDFVVPKISLTHPREEKYGDWSTSVAMEWADKVKMSPMELGELLVKFLNKKIVHSNLAKVIDKIELVKPGFINFYLSSEYLYKELGVILGKGDSYGKPVSGEFPKKKIQVEFISANPTGPLTLGNARGGFLGDTLARVLEFRGHNVEREYYINDTGGQIEALGHSILKDGKEVYKGDYVDTLNKENKLTEPKEVGQWAADRIIEKIIKKTVGRMNIDFDHWFSEKGLYDKGETQRVIDQLKKKGFVYKKDGALWFKATHFPYGAKQDCVLVKSNREFTYLAGDIAYHQNKFLKRNFDQVINIWGADHHGDVPRLKAGVSALDIDVEKKLKFIILQFVHLTEQGREVRMSKRKGTYITIDDLLDEIPLDVARFFFLMYDYNTHMDFDLALASDTSEENPVYYVQYAYARICSIFKKVGARFIARRGAIYHARRGSLDLLNHPSEFSLIRSLAKFPEVVWEVSKTYEIHRLPYYATSLAEHFHKFYKNCRVLGEDKNLSSARLALVEATRVVLKNVLDLMGISAPEKM